MKTLKRTHYYTMNSWNLSTSIAYNLKVYKVIDNELQDKVYDLMNIDGFYNDINYLISDFDNEFNHTWQAGFNGRSGGYLVLYRGGKKLSEHKSYCTNCYQRNFTTIEENNNICGKCSKHTRVNKQFYDTYTNSGLGVELSEVPTDVRKAFRQLAIDIVKTVEYMAKNYTIEEEEITITKNIKVLVTN